MFEAKPEGVQALSHSVAYATTQVLQKVWGGAGGGGVGAGGPPRKRASRAAPRGGGKDAGSHSERTERRWGVGFPVCCG